ncbi:hypothetical protein LCGC14_1320760 [marine sediment metagenome]|uniref:Uncharacterized protein n=1 Tax=marine sediment metagenome TaxID=412755 RepID=A0A0F9NLZ1_9ZZZZ|nr:hypothetical protein [bacterium]
MVKKKVLNIEEAKGIIGSYVEHNILEDLKILGKDHFYDVCECSIGEIKDAFDLLDKNYNYFKGD